MMQLVPAALFAAFAIAAYRMGLRDGMRKLDGLPPGAPIWRGRRSGDADGRVSKLLSNIDAYDGTGKGQRKID
jgi:hypothetical protein